MENIAVSRLMKMINALSVDTKLEVLSKLTESLKIDFHSKKDDKAKLLEELAGSWSDVDDSIVDDIISVRTISGKNI